MPSMLAKMTAVPTPTPLTTPELVTVAMLGAPLDHITVRPDSGCPLAARACAVRVIVRPTTMVGCDGVMVTDATGIGVTVTSAVPVFPPLEPVIVTLPGATPVTTPLAFTVAIAAFEVA
jgi:hypothetical protein